MKREIMLPKTQGALIVGDTKGVGREFARQILAENSPLILADREGEHMRSVKQELEAEYQQANMHLIVEDISHPDAGATIYDASLLYQLLANPPFQINLLINVLAFRSSQNVDPWSEGIEPSYHLGSLLTLIQLLHEDMIQVDQGEILNVLVEPHENDPFLQEVFHRTQSILEEYEQDFNISKTIKMRTLIIQAQH